MELLVFVPLAIGLVTAITQASKKVGLNPTAAPLLELVGGLALVVGGVLTGAVTIPMAGLPVRAEVFWAVVYGLVVGLSAGGFYVDRKTASGN